MYIGAHFPVPFTYSVWPMPTIADLSLKLIPR
jgi:hypothetical protein